MHMAHGGAGTGVWQCRDPMRRRRHCQRWQAVATTSPAPSTHNCLASCVGTILNTDHTLSLALSGALVSKHSPKKWVKRHQRASGEHPETSMHTCLVSCVGTRLNTVQTLSPALSSALVSKHSPKKWMKRHQRASGEHLETSMHTCLVSCVGNRLNTVPTLSAALSGALVSKHSPEKWMKRHQRVSC